MLPASLYLPFVPHVFIFHNSPPWKLRYLPFVLSFLQKYVVHLLKCHIIPCSNRPFELLTTGYFHVYAHITKFLFVFLLLFCLLLVQSTRPQPMKLSRVEGKVFLPHIATLSLKTPVGFLYLWNKISSPYVAFPNEPQPVSSTTPLQHFRHRVT